MCDVHESLPSVKGGRCRSCYNSHMREVNSKRYYARKAWAIELLGGQCVDCATVTDLEFDHFDRFDKTVNVSKILNYQRLRLIEELRRCVLRCKECHIAKSKESGDYAGVGHGEGAIGRAGCDCPLCGPLKETYFAGFESRRQEFEAAQKSLADRKRKMDEVCRCGGYKHHESTICLTCHNQRPQLKAVVHLYPPMDELVEMIRASNFSAVARRISITDNAIRKHLVRNGIDPKTIMK